MTVGTVQELLFHRYNPPPCLHIAVLLHLPRYKGQAFTDDDPLSVPIQSHRFEWLDDSNKPKLSRHKSQGQTLNKAVIDIGKSEKSAGCTFVASSRVRSLQHAVFQPMPL